MALQILPIYLNDHLAGSVAAIELLNHLHKISRVTGREKLFATLQSEVEEDQKEVGEAKLKLDDPGIRTLDLANLERRAREQQQVVETERLKVARAAFAG